MTVRPPVCLDCKHYRPAEATACDAFPDRIPDIVWLGGDRHTSPIPGDHGIRFEPVDAEPQPGKPLRIDGPTPAGGAYCLVMKRPDGSVEIAECDAEGGYIRRTVSTPPGGPSRAGRPVA